MLLQAAAALELLTVVAPQYFLIMGSLANTLKGERAVTEEFECANMYGGASLVQGCVCWPTRSRVSGWQARGRAGRVRRKMA